MVNRGGFSFVAMLVINPIVILFYQNCSMTPVSHAAKAPPVVERHVASEAKPALVTAPETNCHETKDACPEKTE